MLSSENVEWIKPFLIVDKAHLLQYTPYSVYIGMKEGVNSSDMKYCSHFISF